MSDPSVIPEGASEIAKLGGVGGGGALLTLFLGRVFGGQDKVLARLDALQVSVTAIGQQNAVAADRAARFEGDVTGLKVTAQSQGDRLTRLEALVEQLTGEVAR